MALGAAPVGLIAGASHERRGDRFILLAVLLSLAVHLLLALLWFLAAPRLAKLHAFPVPEPTERFVTISSAVRIEHRAVPLPRERAAARRSARAPAARPAQKPAEATAGIKPELTSQKVAAQPAPPQATPRERAPNPPRVRSTPAPRRVAFAPAGPADSERAPLTSERLARLEQEFAKTIAEAKSAADPLRVPNQPPAAPRHYRTQMVGIDGRLSGYEGLCDPIKSWEVSGWDYYYVACNVAFDDGRIERQGVPWPVRFRPEADPFAGTGSRIVPLAAPLPGWTPPAGETITPELRRYLHDRGVDI